MDLVAYPVEIGAQHESDDLEIRDGGHFPRPVDYGRSRSVAWADGVENGRDFLNAVKIPPVCAILHRDILDKGWGWERVVPYRPVDVEWPEFKDHLVAYFKNTVKDKALFAAEPDSLTAAVDLCVKVEKELLVNYFDELELEDILLSRQIRDRATQLISSGCVSSVAAAALLCITKEDELMCELLRRRFETSKVVKFCNMIRRSPQILCFAQILNLMLLLLLVLCWVLQGRLR